MMFGNRFRVISAVAVGAVAAATLMGPPAQAATSTVTGSVSSANGAVGEASVSFYASCQDFGGTPAGSASVMGGSYSVTIPDGTYVVHIRPPSMGWGIVESWHSAEPFCAQATPVTISGDGTLDLVALAGSGVAGTLRFNDGQPVDIVNSLGFYATCQDYLEGKPTPSLVVPRFSEPGGFSALVPEGSYRVLIRWDNVNDSWHGGATTCEKATPVTVSGFYTYLELTIRRGSLVSGTVSTSGGSVTVGGVSFYATCQDYKDGKAAASSPLNASGYTVTVPKGTYRVQIRAMLPAETFSWHESKNSCAEATPVTISGDRTLDLVASIGRAVTGKVSSSTGPVNRGTVAFFPNCDEQSVVMGANAAAFDDGQPYRVTVPDGTYRVFIIPGAGTGAVTSWHIAKNSCEEATGVTVTGDTTMDLVALAEVAPEPSPNPSAPSPSPTTPSTPAPPTATPLGTQSVVKPPKKLNRGKKAELARRTKQRSRVTWRTTTKKICRVTKYTVTGLKKGTCTVKASAPAVVGFAPLARAFTIRVK